MLSDRVSAATALAHRAHAGQKDKAGQPYIEHCLRVRDAFHGESEQIVGVLHDAVEDDRVTVDELRAAGVTEREIAALLLLSHKHGDDYTAYIRRVATDPIAAAVKIADLKDNSDLWSRFANHTILPRDLRRTAKYLFALALLIEIRVCCTGLNGSHTGYCEKNTGDTLVCWCCLRHFPAVWVCSWSGKGSRCLDCDSHVEPCLSRKGVST